MMVEELVSTISEETGQAEDEIQDRIASKVEELSGLVSEEGAAHLVAREEGIELAEAGDKDLTVDNIVPGMNRVDIKCKVADISDVNTFERDGDEEEGRVRNVVLGDPTGTVRLTLWDDQTEIGDKLDVGDNIHVKGAYSREDNRGSVELRVGDDTRISMLEEDVGEVPDTSSGGEHRSARTTEIMNENVNYEVQGTLVELYVDEPFYKACPECQKKVEEENGAWTCGQHGEVEAQDNLIISAIIDDGYGNIRTVFFRDRAEQLLGAEDEDIDGDVDEVQRRAEQVKGSEIAVRGRSRYNDFFNRMELIGNEVAFRQDEDLLEDQLRAVNG